MQNNGIASKMLLCASALLVMVLKTKGISVGDSRLELWPVDGDRGAVLYVYNVEEVNETQIKCTVEPGYATNLTKRDGFIRYSDNDLRELIYKKIYDVDFENDGKMTCSLSGPEKVLISNTLAARILCGETFAAAFRRTYVKNITKLVRRYNKEDFRIADVTFNLQKYEGDLIITHFTLTNSVNCSLIRNANFPFNSFLMYLDERSVKLAYWRNLRHCDGVVGEGFNWPRTPIGTSTAPDNPCEGEDGAPGPIRRCLGDVITGAYWEEESKLGKCRKQSKQAERTRIIANATMDQKSIEKLVEVVTEGPPLSAYEVMLISRKLKKVEEILGDEIIQHKPTNQTLPNVTAVVRIVDAVLESGEKVLKKVEDSSSSTSDIVEAVDHILIASATSVPAINYGLHLSTYSVDEKAGVRGMMSMKENLHSAQAKIHQILWKQDLASVNLSHSLWGFLLMGNTEVGIAASIYSSPGLFDDGNRARRRISPVIGLKVFGKNKTSVRPGTSVLLMFPKDKNYADEKHLCSHWIQRKGKGKWTQEGCARTTSDIVPDNMHGCHCTHFTNFAMLIAHGDPFGNPLDNLALELITKIGCSASFICVTIAFLCSILNPKRFRTVYGKIELNLFLSIFLLDATQLVAMFFQFSPGGDTCIAVGVILHYSVLATFTWMMLVGLMHMLRLSPKTLLSARNAAGNHLLLKATIFGWGLALIPVIATVSDSTSHYVSEFPIPFCYPQDIALYTAVIFPVGLASIINTFIFIWVAAMLLCVKGLRSQGTSWTRQKTRRIFFLIFLFCLLGLYWIFGLLIEATRGHETVQKILKYVFCVTAPLHGLLLFVFLVLCERSVRSKFQETWSSLRRTSRRLVSRITHTGQQKETARFHSVDFDPTGQSISKIELQVSETTEASLAT